jgi:hypothetical protein
VSEKLDPEALADAKQALLDALKKIPQTIDVQIIPQFPPEQASMLLSRFEAQGFEIIHLSTFKAPRRQVQAVEVPGMDMDEMVMLLYVVMRKRSGVEEGKVT